MHCDGTPSHSLKSSGQMKDSYFKPRRSLDRRVVHYSEPTQSSGRTITCYSELGIPAQCEQDSISISFPAPLAIRVLFVLETSCTNSWAIYSSHCYPRTYLSPIKRLRILWEIFERSAARVVVLIIQEEDLIFLHCWLKHLEKHQGGLTGWVCITLRGIKVWLVQARWRLTMRSWQVHRSH